MENWNPIVEHIEGKLCEKELLKERYDFEKNDLVRHLTPKGRIVAEDLLKDPKWLKTYLLLAKKEFSKFPLHIRKILWQKLLNQLR